MKTYVSLIVVSLVAWSGGNSPLSADILIDAGPGSSTMSFANGDYAAGSEFTTTNSINVDSLGWLDAEGDGLVDSHQVGLWDTSDMSLLATATITNSSSTEASAFAGAQWFLEGIDGGGIVTLGPGTYRVAGYLGTIGDNVALRNDKIGNGVTISPGYVRTEFPAGGFNYPDLTFTSEAVRATVGFTSVPEPTSMTILAGFAVLGLARRRRR